MFLFKPKWHPHPAHREFLNDPDKDFFFRELELNCPEMVTIEFKVLNCSYSAGFSMLSCFIQTRSEDLSAFLTYDSRNELIISHHLHYSVDCFPVEKGKTKTTVMCGLLAANGTSPHECCIRVIQQA